MYNVDQVTPRSFRAGAEPTTEGEIISTPLFERKLP